MRMRVTTAHAVRNSRATKQHIINRLVESGVGGSTVSSDVADSAVGVQDACFHYRQLTDNLLLFPACTVVEQIDDP